MPRIEWNESFSVNNSEIDNQHKKWIEIFNKMHEGLVAKEGTNYQSIAVETLQAMHEYALQHFTFEEEYMRKMNFPDLIGHRRIHKDFDTLIFSYNRDIRNGTLVLNTHILKLIENWLRDHILVEDKKYAKYLAAQDQASDKEQ